MPERLTRPVCLADYEQLAYRRLDANALAFFAGGAADEITVRWNREAFDALALRPRVLRGGSGGHTRLSLFGRDFQHPIFVAPMALQKLAHGDGEMATAIAAERQDAGMVLSAQASVSMEDAYRAGATCRWFQLYVQPTRAATMQRSGGPRTRGSRSSSSPWTHLSAACARASTAPAFICPPASRR